MNAVRDTIRSMFAVPTLRDHALRSVFAQLDLVLPGWTTGIITENLHLRDKLQFVTQSLDRIKIRLHRHKARIRGALHNLRYMHQKMEEIELMLDRRQYRRAQSELRTLRSLDGVQDELQSLYRLVTVSITSSFSLNFCCYNLHELYSAPVICVQQLSPINVTNIRHQLNCPSDLLCLTSAKILFKWKESSPLKLFR